MGKLRRIDSSGDSVLAKWDTKRAEVGDPEALAAVREAERIFKEQRKSGVIAFQVGAGHDARLLTEFNPEAEQIILIPKVAGG